jgi:hypothetical protein
MLLTSLIALTLFLIWLFSHEPPPCPNCGNHALQDTEPAPSIWQMECSVCGQVTDRNGELHEEVDWRDL